MLSKERHQTATRPDRLDAACKRALEINARSYSSVHSILKNGLERKPGTRAAEEPAITHPNIRRPQRGACYTWPAFGGTRRLLPLKGYSCCPTQEAMRCASLTRRQNSSNRIARTSCAR
ncbi:hypothetical protein ETW24_04685 [Leisingera sp. NJS204]|nr:hypothetical protein ETW24_04685 [Leisingera sp. NJS204]